jgi:hypothetical protein
VPALRAYLDRGTAKAAKSADPRSDLRDRLIQLAVPAGTRGSAGTTPFPGAHGIVSAAANS